MAEVLSTIQGEPVADKFDTLLERLAQSVADDYEEARTNATAGNPQRAGHEGEGTWTRILRDWGPGWPVVTRKYIVGPGGSSNEVDVVILRPDYPTHLHHEPSVLSSGVAAAFSSKTTARRADVFEAVTQKRQLLAAAGPAGSRSPREILQGPFPFGLLAHGVDAKGNRAEQTNRLIEWHEAASADATHPSEELDVMLVATTSLLSNYRSTLAPRGSEWHPMTSIVTHKEHPAPGAPLAQFIYWLNQRLATPDRSAALAGLGEKYGAAEASGTMRWWDIGLYPEHIRENLHVLLNEYGHPLSY